MGVGQTSDLPDGTVVTVYGELLWHDYPTGQTELCYHTQPRIVVPIAGQSEPPGCASAVIIVRGLAPDLIPPDSVYGTYGWLPYLEVTGRISGP